jgi:4-oxalomesaconate hydratase
MNPTNMLVIGAHSADFVWRSAGAIALAVKGGGSATVVALSYGERGESGELWKEPGQTIENVKRVRHEEANAAAGALGAEFLCLDLGDYPLTISSEAAARLVDLLREHAPDVLVTHTPLDPFNPDHPVANEAVLKARLLAAGAGVASAFERIDPPDLYFFEPHQPELCEVMPNTFVDITPVMDRKVQAMSAMKAQSYLQEYYTDLAARRGNHARRISGNKGIRFAEAYQRALPRVVDRL